MMAHYYGAKRHRKSPIPKRILIVDDIEHIRKLLRAFLEDESGLAVCGEAVDGFDAIEKAPGLRPDLIALDLSMPRMDGIQTAKQLKKILPGTPIILFTMHEGLMKASLPNVGNLHSGRSTFDPWHVHRYKRFVLLDFGEVGRAGVRRGFEKPF